MKRKNCQRCGRFHYRTGGAVNCAPCAFVYVKASQAATAKVAAAVKKGLMPHVKMLVCVDCGRPAKRYDHRDYNKPLAVDPVCQPCNFRRGHGRLPDFIGIAA